MGTAPVDDYVNSMEALAPSPDGSWMQQRFENMSIHGSQPR